MRHKVGAHKVRQIAVLL